jgi:hypothetical protein
LSRSYLQEGGFSCAALLLKSLLGDSQPPFTFA